MRAHWMTAPLLTIVSEVTSSHFHTGLLNPAPSSGKALHKDKYEDLGFLEAFLVAAYNRQVS